MPTMKSFFEMQAEKDRLLALNEGWTCLPADEPETAVFGMIAFRHVDANGKPVQEGHVHPEGGMEEAIHYEWFPYGKPLVPSITTTDNPADFCKLLRELQAKHLIFPCDDAKARHLGFVGYDGVTAKIVRIPLTQIKEEMAGGFDESFRIEIQISSALMLRSWHSRL